MPAGKRVRKIIIIFDDHSTKFVEPPIPLTYTIIPNSTGRDVVPKATWEDHQITWTEQHKEGSTPYDGSSDQVG